MRIISFLFVLAMLLFNLSVQARENIEGTAPAVSTPAAASVKSDIEANIKIGLQGIIPGVNITRISPSPIANLYEVLIGSDVVYMTGDGRYVMKGDLLDMQERRNLSDEQRASIRKELLSKLSPDEMIEFAPKEETKYVAYVFTDVDCGYCRKLHLDVEKHNENGIAIRYLAYPRAGINSRTFEVMQSIWCADDRKQALTDAKNGIQIEAKQCSNPIAKQYKLGQQLGVRGTPAIFLENGEEVPGYMPPGELLKRVGG